MKDLKENIQRKNMRKLVLSAVLGIFCYCTNNASKKEEEAPQIVIENIIDVLGNMIGAQVNIFKAKEAIKEKGKNIYTTIKDKNGKVTKGNLLNFIQEQFKADDEESFKQGIYNLEQYFHLGKISENEECTKDKLTEIFWEEQEGEEKISEKGKDITNYLIEIANSEDIINGCFTRYYCIKKAEKTKEGKEKKKEEIIEEITNECCKGDKEGDPHAKFLANLGNICEYEGLKEQIEDKKEDILKAIQRRITLDKEITKENLKSFIKQKIVIEEEKEEEKKDSTKSGKPAEEEEKKNTQKNGKPAEEEGCSCCNDCCRKEGKPVVLTKKIKK